MLLSRLTAVITGLMLTGWSHKACAKYSLSQLRMIEQLILDKDLGALLSYLRENPDLMVGDNELSRELRSFRTNFDGKLIQSVSSKSNADSNQVQPEADFEF